MWFTAASRPSCHGESERMKAARVVVLTVAIAAGGVAALLAGRSGSPPEVKVEAPKFNTVDILVAKSDISRGQTLTPAEVAWEAWPTTTASGNFIRKSDRPKALENLTGMIVRAPFVAGEPIREAKLVNSKGSGFMAAILPSGMRAVATQISPESGVGGKTATLELTPAQVETLALSHQIGVLSLSLRSIADGTLEEKTDDSTRQNVNIVRFGVRTTTTPR